MSSDRIDTGTRRRSMMEQALGNDYRRLDSAVQRFHRLGGLQVLNGDVETKAPRSRPGKFLASIARAPLESGLGPMRFELAASPQRERWTRHFPGQTMHSILSVEGGKIVERIGLARLTFAVAAVDGALVMQLERFQFLGIPCPRWLMPRIDAREEGDADRLMFHIRATAPGAGLIAAYRGYLLMPGDPPVWPPSPVANLPEKKARKSGPPSRSFTAPGRDDFSA